MKTSSSLNLRRLTDDELVVRVKELAGQHRNTTVELILHLAELESRGLHLRASYGSLFEYCCDALRLSESEAYARIKAARAVGRFPVLIEMLERGDVNLTTVRLLAPLLTASNHLAVLESARGLPKRDVERLVARLDPRPDVPERIRKLPTPAAPPMLSPPIATAGAAPSLLPPAPPVGDAPTAVVAAVPPPRPAVVQPLSPERYKLQVTIGGETLEKLEQARDRLRHAVPSGDAAEILDRALAALLEALDKKQRAATDQPRPSSGAQPGSRHIPAEVTRTVYQRDEGRCAYVGPEGRRCTETALLERHHIDPYVEGGPPVVPNIALRCRQHNAYEWKRHLAARHEDEERWRALPGGRILRAPTSATGSGTRS
jgi:hypothetical protein